MIKFRAVKRAGNFYLDRGEFLTKRIELARSELKSSHRLCNVLAKVNGPLKRSKGPGPFLGPELPWLTLILGSGCSSESTEGAMWVSADSISNSLIGKPNLPDGKSPVEIVRSFVHSLIRLREPNVAESKNEELTHRGNWETVALLMLVTALLTRLFHEAAALLERPLHPRASDRILLQRGFRDIAPQRYGEILDGFVKPTRMYVRELLRRAELEDLSPAVYTILEKVERDLNGVDGHCIDQVNLQILTEFSWLELTTWSTVYPGWSDLLADLARLDDPMDGDRPYGFPPRPRLRRAQLLESIGKTYMHVTNESWRMRHANESTERQKFFDSAANVLMAQAELRRQILGDTDADAPPFACAFSTSFDVELEMALASRDDVQGFIIALPIYFQSRSALADDDDPDTASFRWIGAVIAPKVGTKTIELQDILRPTTWIRLSGLDSTLTGWEYQDWPFVIHLAGSPLIELPDVEVATSLSLHQTDPDQAFHDDWSKIKAERVVPALLLDEYDAMQQHSSEMFHVGPGSSGSLGLPGTFTSGGITGVAEERYWMVMGVQMDDTAVRHRVASKLGIASTQEVSTSNRMPLTAGLVVVKNVGPAARDLLQWFGVDIVKSACSGFREDLDHYADHLRKREMLTASKDGCGTSK
ncbi:hypothetical protein KAK07_11830 [Ideonella sp. 4Y16]|uniref:hypothetical protein n=1 Tax=Ideonella alba TaxID=2824118 RepID=UPI001B396109|nr:hypothetical protein [Ideonella alba]MBQ0944024.1 hypothetical protein [Ideonella alba]